ncbi:hypothetical protein BD289DRAFT_441964 [Coniella lustricola]|uniref:Pentatricopeptide repeat domain-containing protein n=1 Tax=Coniella lustricola TaxID=2025994 RepID=A0A2T2ZYR5_9PEZI|nr:hypothetical protein BD289DRAFT_441964 [Coniella lustricola]
MQSLWSRAAQAQPHICTCKTCADVISIAAIASPLSTLAGRRRSTPRKTHPSRARSASSLIHSTVPPAPSEDQRRHRLVKSIWRTPEEQQTQRRQAPPPSSTQWRDRQERPLATMRVRAPLSGIEALNSICKMSETLDRHQGSKHRLYSFLRHIHRTYDPLERLGTRYTSYLGPNLASVDTALRQEMADEKKHKDREPLSTEQFERYHVMINNMVDRLVAQSYYDELPGDPARARFKLESLDSAKTAIRMLRSEGYPSYNHPTVNPTTTIEARDQLADMLRGLFDKWPVEDVPKQKFQVAKICYNLLVCSVPPSIHHYNILLFGFMRLKMYNLVDIVIHSLLEESRLRPTTQTIVCLLLCYRQKKDIQGFYNIIRRMMAIDNRGMLIRRRWYEDVVKIPALHQWANQPEVTTSLKANWVIERPSRSQDVYEALVSGLLGLGRVKDATKVFVGSLQEKIGTSVELFTYLIKQCLYTLDVSAADILQRGLIDNTSVVVSLILRSDCPRRLAEQLYPILNMGKPPSWPFSEERAQMSWTSGTMVVSPEDRGRIRHITTALFIRQAETQVRRLDTVLRRAMYMLRVAHPNARIAIALCGISELNELQRHHRRVAGRLLKHQALLRVTRLLESQTWDIAPGRIGLMHGRVVGMLEEYIPREAKPGGYERWEAVADISEAADYWLRYRISKIESGDRGDARRLLLETELALVVGTRLRRETLRTLLAETAWYSVTSDVAEDLATQYGLAGSQDVEEDPVEEQGLWPRAEKGAMLAG